MMGTHNDTPIFIMSFNRPEYLRRVLVSLRDQVDCDLTRRRLVLWQDGAISRFTARERAQIGDLEKCKAAFEEIFPKGIVMDSDVNLGVALNFDRAERFAFEELKTEAAIFLEDDLVLSPHYIATLDQLIATFSEDSRVGYVAAYGDHKNPLSDQQINHNKLILLYHNWGFALYRRQWLRMRDRVQRYLGLLADREYTERDHTAIFELFASGVRAASLLTRRRENRHLLHG